jgi:hypothetical protein
LQQLQTDDVFELTGKLSMNDGEIRRRIMHYTKGREPHEIGSWTKAERDSMLRELKEAGLSIRQIERATGISRGIVAKS